MASVTALARRISSLSTAERSVVESVVELLEHQTTRATKRSTKLSGHPSFGAWSKRKDLPADSDEAARELRRRASSRGVE